MAPTWRPEPVSGRGVVATFTVNHQPWDGQRRALRDRHRRAGGAGGPPAHHQHRGLRRSTRCAIGDAGAGRLRAARPGLVPPVRGGGARDRLRAALDHLRHRPVRGRPPPGPHGPGPHRSRRPWSRSPTPGSRWPTSTASRPTRGGGPAGAGFSGPGTPEVQDALRLELELALGRHRGRRPSSRAVVNAVMAVVPAWPTTCSCTAPSPRPPSRARAGARGSASAVGAVAGHRRLDPVEHPVPGVLGGQLAGDERPAPLPRVRHHARAARPDRGQRPAQRRPQPQGRLPGPDDPRRLPRRPDDHHAVPPVRLRRAGRRLHRGRRVARRARRRRRPSRGPGRGGGHRAAGAARRGTSSTTSPPWRRETRAPTSGAAPTSPRPTSTWPSSTTASASSPWPGSRPSASAARASGGPFVEGGQPHRPRRRAAPQHQRRPALGRAPPRLRLPPRGLPPAARRGGRAPGARRPRWPPWATAAARSPGAMLLTREA